MQDGDRFRNTVERVWHAKTDEELSEASTHLWDYTEEGQRVIREELRRRALPEPPPDESLVFEVPCRCNAGSAPNPSSCRIGKLVVTTSRVSFMSAGMTGTRAKTLGFAAHVLGGFFGAWALRDSAIARYSRADNAGSWTLQRSGVRWEMNESKSGLTVQVSGTTESGEEVSFCLFGGEIGSVRPHLS